MIRTNFFLLVMLFIIPISVFAQRGNKKQEPTKHFNVYTNYYSGTNALTFKRFANFNEENLDLIFETPISGTFTLLPGDEIEYEEIRTLKPPTQTIGIALSYQKINNEKFHEFTLSRLSYNTTDNYSEIQYINVAEGEVWYAESGYKERFFTIGMRFEKGEFVKYQKDKKVQFGIAYSLEGTFTNFNSLAFRSWEFDLKGNLLELEFGISTRFQFNLSDNLLLIFKFIPSAHVLSHNTISWLNPSIDIRSQKGTRDTSLDLKNFRYTIGFGLSYQLNSVGSASRKRGRR